ncbi:hypothetical protein AVEN_274362-1 [Araneus ventricosus]|uniref:Uncharacterized protein n=1 Tax=Araneus ventricosus TaxID=182803 RepID=A0A4Y2GAT0_ARAVE|nr:hypothetical protein AVEN_274362-1 [Araneus ventricosus]
MSVASEKESFSIKIEFFNLFCLALVMKIERHPMPPYLMPLQQPNRLDGHRAGYENRMPPHAPCLVPLRHPNRLDEHGTGYEDKTLP